MRRVTCKKQWANGVRHDAARRCVAALTVGALALGSVGCGPAYAEPVYGTGSITIAQSEGNNTAFEGYRLFSANVRDDSAASTGKVAMNLQWASPEARTAMESVAGTSFQSAQDAADWLERNVVGTTDQTRVEADSIANRIASSVAKTTDAVHVEAGQATQGLQEGYWLFVTANDSVDEPGEMGTAPIFAVIGGSPVTVTEKTSVVAASKKVLNNEEGSTEGLAADAASGQALGYTVQGTVPDNIATFSAQGARFFYGFKDVLSQGLDYRDSTARVLVDGEDVTDSFDIAYDAETRTLSATCEHLEELAQPGSTVRLTYDAALNAQAVCGGEGNPNTASIEYSSNPNTDQHGSLTPPVVRTYTFALSLLKVDRNTEKPLEGARFTVAAPGGGYVQADGSVADEAYEFATDSDGTVSVAGLDVGSYTISESASPARYQKTRDFTVDIKAAYDTGGALVELSSTVGGNADAVAGIPDGTTGDNVLSAQAGTGSDVGNGVVYVTVGDARDFNLPLTGSNGAVAAVGVGACAVAGGVVLNVSRRRRRAFNGRAHHVGQRSAR